MAVLDKFSGGGLCDVLPAIIQDRTDEIEADVKTYAELGGVFVLLLCGLYVQFNHTAKVKRMKNKNNSVGFPPQKIRRRVRVQSYQLCLNLHVLFLYFTPKCTLDIMLSFFSLCA